MTMLALLTLPWIRNMERINNIVPRVLADDLCLWIRDIAQDAELLTGDRQYVRDMCRAIMATLDFLTSMGARVAHNKSLLLASEGNVRKWLRKQRWGSEQIPIPVANCARDLWGLCQYDSGSAWGHTQCQV